MNKMKKSCLVLVALLGVAVAEVAQISKCDEYSDDICEVTEVRITPCRLHNSRCVLKKGEQISTEIDFIPKFDAASLTAGLWYEPIPGGEDIAIPEFSNIDACPYSSCPTESGQSQQLSYSMPVRKSLASTTYQFKWKLWDAEDKTKTCCFKIMVALSNY